MTFDRNYKKKTHSTTANLKREANKNPHIIMMKTLFFIKSSEESNFQIVFSQTFSIFWKFVAQTPTNKFALQIICVYFSFNTHNIAELIRAIVYKGNGHKQICLTFVQMRLRRKPLTRTEPVDRVIHCHETS